MQWGCTGSLVFLIHRYGAEFSSRYNSSELLDLICGPFCDVVDDSPPLLLVCGPFYVLVVVVVVGDEAPPLVVVGVVVVVGIVVVVVLLFYSNPLNVLQ